MTVDVTVADDATVQTAEDPTGRAEARFAKLRGTFTDAIVVVSQMYADGDWQFLTREDGSPYDSMVEVIQDASGLGRAQAARILQGATTLYVPLMELVADGTVVTIRSDDVAHLGKDGAAQVVDEVRSRVEGVEDPDESAAVVREVIDEVRDAKDAERAARKEPRRQPDDEPDEDWDDGGVDGGDGLDDPDDGGGAPAPDLTDPLAELLDGAEDYTDLAALASLPDGLREYTASLGVIAAADPRVIASQVTRARRGVLRLVADATANVVKTRALIDGQGWVMDAMSGE
jgi:hypothetical protein